MMISMDAANVLDAYVDQLPDPYVPSFHDLMVQAEVTAGMLAVALGHGLSLDEGVAVLARVHSALEEFGQAAAETHIARAGGRN